MNTCPAHGAPLPPACPGCRAASRRSIDTMSRDERADELAIYMEMLTIPFAAVHARAEELVGRPVWTHEFAEPALLIREARTGEHPADLEGHVMSLLRDVVGDKPVVIVVSNDPQETA